MLGQICYTILIPFSVKSLPENKANKCKNRSRRQKKFPDDVLSAPASSFTLTLKICSWEFWPLKSMHSWWFCLNIFEMSLCPLPQKGFNHILTQCSSKAFSVMAKGISHPGFFKICRYLCSKLDLLNQNFQKMMPGNMHVLSLQCPVVIDLESFCSFPFTRTTRLPKSPSMPPQINCTVVSLLCLSSILNNNLGVALSTAEVMTMLFVFNQSSDHGLVWPRNFPQISLKEKSSWHYWNFVKTEM